MLFRQLQKITKKSLFATLFLNLRYNQGMTANVANNKLGGISESCSFGDVCLLGCKVTGRAIFEYFVSHAKQLNSLAIFGLSAGDAADLEGWLKDRNLSQDKLPFKLALYVGEQEVHGNYDLAIASPGIPYHTPFYQSALKCAKELICEPELAWRISPERWIGVTGTNGKTTTTSLIAHLLNEAGIKARTVGNIGNPCIEAIVKRSADEYLIAELSSYQLYSTVQFAPDTAVLLGITPDHFSWHGSYEAYEQAKLKIFGNLAAESLAVVDATNEPACAALRALRENNQPSIGVGTCEGLYHSMAAQCGAQNAAYVSPDSHTLTVVFDKKPHELCHIADLKIRGPHNITNALLAASVALHVGATPKQVTQGLQSFSAPEHRLEPCGEVDGVRFYNDSKATNTDAAIKAVESFGDDEGRKVIALFGGSDKGTELDELVTACSRNCKTVLCYGEAGERLYKAFSTCDAFEVLPLKDFSEACVAAVAASAEGDTILLSPACASFDEFPCFEARGGAFKEFVAGLRAGLRPREAAEKAMLAAKELC